MNLLPFPVKESICVEDLLFLIDHNMSLVDPNRSEEIWENCVFNQLRLISSKQTTSFWRLYNVHNVQTTSYGRQNNVVCVLGINIEFHKYREFHLRQPFWSQVKPLLLLSLFLFVILFTLRLLLKISIFENIYKNHILQIILLIE